jgi:hypothetical protein
MNPLVQFDANRHWAEIEQRLKIRLYTPAPS